MKMPREIAEDIFLDEESETVALCIDRVSLMLDMKEFFDLAKRLDTALKELAAATASMEEAEEEESLSDNIVQFKNYKLSDDEEFH